MGINFFKNLFQKKMDGPLTVSVSDVPALVEKEFLVKKKELEDLSAKKMSEVKYAHAKAVALVEQISSKELEAKENERLNRAAVTAKNQMVKQLSALLAKLEPKSIGSDISSVRAYSGEGHALLSSEIISFRKSIAFTTLYFKDEMKLLGTHLQEILDAFAALNLAFANEKDLFEFEKFRERADFVVQNKKLEKRLLAELDILKKNLEALRLEVVEQKKKISDKSGGEDMKKLSALEEEVSSLAQKKQELKTQISALLINIDRPLARFKQLVDSGRWRIKKEEQEALEVFLTNPVLGLKKDPKAVVFKRVLEEVVEAIRIGKIELKDKEKEKRLAALSDIISYDFFGEVFWKMNELQKKQDELNRLLSENRAKSDMDKETKRLSELEKSVLESEDIVAEKEKSISVIRRENEGILAGVRQFGEKYLHREITLVTD